MRDRLQWVRWPLWASAAVLALALPAGAVAAGGTGALAAAGGVLLVVGSYTVSGVAIAWADTVDPRLVLPVGLVTYVVKFSLLGVALLSLAGTGWGGVAPLATAAIVTVVVWVVAQVTWTWRARLPYVHTEGEGARTPQ